MNIINRYLLRFILIPASFYEKAGIHLPHLKAILTAKLTIDDRRPNSFQQVKQQTDEPKAINNATLGTIFISLLFGLFMLISLLYGSNYTTKLTLFFSMYIFMLAGTLITDFTTVLLDIRDNLIILPKPVNDRTVVMARLFHIFIHISKLAVPLSLPAVLLIAIMKGITGALLIIPLLFIATALTIFFVNAAYLLVLKITSPEKFKNFITYFQILFAVLIFASYQVVPRIINKAHLENLDITQIKWIWLLPPYWLGRTWDAFILWRMTEADLIAISLCVILPVLFIWLVIKFFAPSFNKKLSMISGGSESTTTASHKIQSSTSTKKIATVLASIFAKQGTERAGFQLCWNMMSRSREFKIKVYPSIGYLGIYLFILLFNQKGTGSLNDPDAKRIIFITVTYISSMLVSTALQHITVSEKWKASWIYFTAPVQQPGMLITASVKAALVRFFLPVVIIVSTASVILWGISMIPNLALGFINQILFFMISSLVTLQKLPFSNAPENVVKGNSFLRGLFVLVLIGTLGLIHYILFEKIWIITILSCISLMVSYVLFRKLGNTTWRQLKMNYEV